MCSPFTMKAFRRIKTSHVFHIEENNREVGGLQNSFSPGSEKPFEQEGHFEYFGNKEEAIKKYHKLAWVEDQNISCIIGFDWRNNQRSIVYQATNFSLEDIISNKALFWEFDAQGESTCMTNDLQTFLIAIWEGLLSFNQQNIGIQYIEDFKKIYLVDGKLSEPKLYIQKVTEFTDKVDDLKQKAAILTSIILGIRTRQGLLNSYRGLESLKKVLEVISCCEFPLSS